MDYGMIGKIEKAQRYAQERDRFNFESFTVSFAGDNNPHTITFESGVFECNCDFFLLRGRCSHTMALEKILDQMIKVAEPA